MRIQLTNDFHNTSCYVVTKDGYLTKRQAKEAWKKLCGIRDCECGDIAGCRPAMFVETEDGWAELK